ncbi:DUF5011 domain-containing protein [Marinimicrobium locisalis]|uniref:DUF5011 domain-containing protein n=1 Tax=Marinimicrobium locisalis TaxID=546022 RepID=UPI0032221ADB
MTAEKPDIVNRLWDKKEEGKMAYKNMVAIPFIVTLMVACGGEETGDNGPVPSPPTDNSAPTLTLSGASSMTLPFNQTYSEPGVTASDPEDGDISSEVTISGAVDSDVPGEYTLTYTVTDSGGATASVTRQVEVLANQAPTVTLLGDTTISLTEGGTFDDPGATATDNEDGDLSDAIVVDLGGLDANVPGTYTVTYSVQDTEGLLAEAARTVEVNAVLTERSHSMGMGLTAIRDWSPQMPFLDLMKQSRGWNDWINQTDLPFDVDDNGWLLSLQEGQTAGTVFLVLEQEPWENQRPFTRVHVFYEGEGALRYTGASNKLENESEPGHEVVNVDWGASFLSITETDPADPLRNIRIIPEPFLAAYEAGEIFNPGWVERIDQFRALRFMDWMGTNDSDLSRWADRPQRSHRTWRTAPLGVMIDLANKIGADPWFNIPHLADEDYMERFAAQLEAELNPALTVYIEHSNEVWNWGFQQAQYANVAGRARWGDAGDAYMQWHGMRTAQVCDAFKLGAFAESTERVKCVLGVQTAWHGLESGALECPLWVAEGNTPCYQHGIDYIAITSYFGGSLIPPRDIDSENDDQWEAIIRGWIAEGDAGVEKATNYLLTGEGFGDLGRENHQNGVRGYMLGELDYWVDVAHTYNMEVISYEGGQHITANGKALQNDQDIIDFHIAVNNHPGMGDVYTELFNAWKDGGGQLHMHFVDISRHTRYGSWGALTNYKQESSPRWDAIQDFNLNVACWWTGCDEP